MALMIFLYAQKVDYLHEQIRDQQETIDGFRDFRGTKIREFYDQLCSRDPAMADIWQLDTVANVIRIDSINGEPILFDKAKWAIRQDDLPRLQNVVNIVAREMTDHDYTVLQINGTADPDPLTGHHFLSDNIELSAMRAAAVARVLNGAASGIEQNRIRVVGLGEVGQVVSNAEKKRAYQKYRTVRMEIHIEDNVLSTTAGRK